MRDPSKTQGDVMGVAAGRLGPTGQSERIGLIDVLRGFAVFGILVANMAGFSGMPSGIAAWNQPLDRIIFSLIRFLVQAKFYTLFSFLFGWGFALQMRRADLRDRAFLPLYLRRTLALLLFGIIHGSLIWTGDILTFYAVLGLVLLLFRRRSIRFLLVSSAVALALAILLTLPWQAMESFRNAFQELVSPLILSRYSQSIYAAGSFLEITRLRVQDFLGGTIYSFYAFGNVFGMFLLGLAAGKARLFEDLKDHLPRFRRALGPVLLLGLLFNALFLCALLHPEYFPQEYQTSIRVGARTIGAPLLTMAYVMGIALLFQNSRWKMKISVLAPVGQMALSNYIFQSVACTLIFYDYGLGLYGHLDPLGGLLLTLAVYAVQIRLSSWWLERYQYGPLEWFWRMLTYGDPPALHRRYPFERDPLRTTRTPRTTGGRLVMISISTFLCIWGAGLLFWGHSMRGDLVDQRSLYSAIRSAAPDLENITTEGATGSGGELARPALLEQAAALERVPQSLAAGGDLAALASAFDASRALQDVEALASRRYAGRQAGTLGSEAAGDYLAGQFEALDLVPAGEGGTYYQSFDVPYSVVSEIPELAVWTWGSSDQQAFHFLQDYSIVAGGYAGAGEARASVIWVDDCQADDFNHIDVVGQIVFCQRTPGVDEDRNAIEHGAAGLLLLNDESGQPLDFAYPRFEPLVPEPIPVMLVGPRVSAALLANSGISLQDLRLSSLPRPLQSEVRLKVVLQGSETCVNDVCRGRNVLGLLPGSDPSYSDQLVVLSAHYDHMGVSPEGTMWPGANDDASGVAVLLEIARTWQEQGYLPKRSVLFAAWDAEELGLMGSRAYLANPTIPLDSILADIQLDMVGAGGSILAIGGDESLGRLLEGAGDAYGVETFLGDFGRSDHVSFLEHGLPGALLIWHDPEDQYKDYHRPADTADHIDLVKLQQAGKVVHLALLSLVDGEPTIQDLLNQRASALLAGDLTAFLKTGDPKQAALDQLWYASARANSISDLNFELRDLTLKGDEAYGDLRATLTYAQGEEPASVQSEVRDLAVRFKRVEGSWRWSGPALEDVTPLLQAEAFAPLASDLELEVFARQPAELAGLDRLEPSLEWLNRLSVQLGLSMPSGLKIEIFSNSNELCVLSELDPDCTGPAWIGPGTIRLMDWVLRTDGEMLEDALAQWLLYEHGMRADLAPWLWAGLPIAFRIHENPGAGEDAFTILYKSLFLERQPRADVESWAAVEFQLDRLDWRGLGGLIQRLAAGCADRNCTLPEERTAALLTGLGMTPDEFEAAWHQAWVGRYESVMQELQNTLDRRAQTVLNAEQNSFLRTVDPSVRDLLKEQQQYFLRLRAIEVDHLSWKAEPRVLYPDGRVLAVVGPANTSDAEQNLTELEHNGSTILFTPSEGGLRWAGYPFQELRRGRTSVLYPSDYEMYAEDILAYGELAYRRVVDALGIPSARPLTLKIYNDENALANSIPILVDDVPTDLWTTPEGSIQIRITAEQLAEGEAFQATLVEALIRSLLEDAGLNREWLVRGLSLFLEPELDNRTRLFSATRDLRSLATAAAHDELPLLTEIQGDKLLDDDARGMANAQCWDAARTLNELYGSAALSDLLQLSFRGTDFDEAFEIATGITPAEYELVWLKTYQHAHLDPSWPAVASAFDIEQAMEHIAELTGPAYSGRGTGTPGAAAAASYIQTQFQRYGLMPWMPAEQTWVPDKGTLAGPDQDSAQLVEGSSSKDPADNLSYFQQFPIYRVLYERAPSLTLTYMGTSLQREFLYREEFIDLPQSYDYAGEVRGDLVWVDAERGYPPADLSGKIVMHIESADPAQDASRAVKHHASGLILVSPRALVAPFLEKTPVPVGLPESAGIPVFRINQGIYQGILREAGLRESELKAGPQLAQLGITARLDLPLLPPQMIQAVNVLGMLPGSDPELADEVVILGAHYDHVGDDPDAWHCRPGTNPSEQSLASGACQINPGIRYPGTNDDASGIAVLLEIARLWQQAGYQPARSILFAAWDAQEPGQIGSTYYGEHPVIPIADTSAMIQLDSVAGGRGYYLEVHGTLEHDGLLTATASLLEAPADLRLTLVRKSIDSGSFQPIEPAHWLTWPQAMDEETSDHLIFRDQGVPSALLTWRGASEANGPEGEEDIVQPERLAKAGRLAALLAMSLAR